ncbi:MAG: hypothetical protein AAF152_19545 [Cyanobacteria bacterium P01_A01_bin.114]
MHTYEVFVDIKECDEPTCLMSHVMATRYEINADTLNSAHDSALYQAEHEYPRATEYDIRVTRVLR